jgi:predicted nucleic acid-binding protein
MSAYADTGFITSLFLPETTSAAARKTAAHLRAPLPLIPLSKLEFRNSLNLAIIRRRISMAERDALWRQFETQIKAGFFVETAISSVELFAGAQELSDRHTPGLATRSLDLLHVAAAKIFGVREFYSFDDRQRKAAAAEGMTVKP